MKCCLLDLAYNDFIPAEPKSASDATSVTWAGKSEGGRNVFKWRGGSGCVVLPFGE